MLIFVYLYHVSPANVSVNDTQELASSRGRNFFTLATASLQHDFRYFWFVWFFWAQSMQKCVFLSLAAHHYCDVIIGAMASQITSLTIVYSTVYSGVDQRKYQSSASMAFVWGIHRWPVNSPHKWPVMRKMLPFDDVITPNDRTEIHGM